MAKKVWNLRKLVRWAQHASPASFIFKIPKQPFFHHSTVTQKLVYLKTLLEQWPGNWPQQGGKKHKKWKNDRRHWRENMISMSWRRELDRTTNYAQYFCVFRTQNGNPGREGVICWLRFQSQPDMFSEKPWPAGIHFLETTEPGLQMSSRNCSKLFFLSC